MQGHGPEILGRKSQGGKMRWVIAPAGLGRDGSIVLKKTPMMGGLSWIALVFLVQALLAVLFIADLFSSVFGLEAFPLSWRLRELLEISSALGLIIGVVLGGLALRAAVRERNLALERLKRARGAFFDLLKDRFRAWVLSDAEREVALFSIKGMSAAEIAALRKTSEATVKAQTNAIYRKAGVSGRAQLLSLIIDDLMRDDVTRDLPADQP